MALRHVLIAVGVVLLSISTCLGAPAAAVSWKAWTANLKGDILVLDVGTLHNQGNHPFGPYISTSAGCKEYCSRLPGCTGYNFCNSKTGCGFGCKAYAASHPAPAVTKLPILHFGPYYGSCTTDAWPYGLCSLKKVANPAKPEFWSTNAAEGWESGVLQLPSQCTGLSQVTCERCLASKNPAACISCAKGASTYAEGSLKAITGYAYQSTWSEGCAACVALPAGSKVYAACPVCLAKGQTCGQCAADMVDKNQIRPFDLSVCMSCAQTYPKSYSECRGCAGLKTTAQQAKCTSCIKTLYPNMCPWPVLGYDKVCIGRGWNDPEQCYRCASMPGSLPDLCIKCASTMPYNEDCYQCQSVKAAYQAACYDCAFKAGLGQDRSQSISAGGSYQCSECLNPIGSTAGSKICLACLADPKVPTSGKYWCNMCNERFYDNAKRRQQCLDCIKKPYSDYFSACG